MIMWISPNPRRWHISAKLSNMALPKNMIEGLSRIGEQYDEAIKCLENRYNKPRLIHKGNGDTGLKGYRGGGIQYRDGGIRYRAEGIQG